MSCYPIVTDQNIRDLASVRSPRDGRISNCGPGHKCLSSYNQFGGFGYPLLKDNINYSVSINVENVTQQFADELCNIS